MKRYFAVLCTLLIGTAAVFAAGGSQGSGAALNYPNRPVEILVPANPGSSTDFSVRLFAPYLEKHLGVPVVITNNKVANGAISMQRVKDASADGYLWGWWLLQNLSQVSVLGELAGVIDASKDYVYGGTVYASPFIVISPKSRGWKNLADLTAAAKANPGTVTWARGNPYDVNADHIRYFERTFPGAVIKPIDGMADGAKALSAIMGGHLDVFCDYVATSYQMYQDGMIDILAVGADERLPILPEVATYNEQGFSLPGTSQSSNWAFYGPARTDKAVLDIFSAAVKKAFDEPEYREKVLQNMGVHMYMDSAASHQALLNMMDFFKETKTELGL